MKPLPLLNASILVTRPDQGGEKLCESIAAEGGHAIHFPTIAFAPPQDETTLKAAISQLPKQDYWIFISPYAVKSSLPWISPHWPAFSSHGKIAAVGAGTAEALAQSGIKVDLFPISEWSSEGLLALPEFQSVQNRNIAIIRGEGGRMFLDESLSARGASVLPVITYRRVLPEASFESYCEATSLKLAQINAIVCASFEAVVNLKTLVGANAWPILQQIPLVVMSERIKLLALSLGFQTIWVSEYASQEAQLVVLRQLVKGK